MGSSEISIEVWDQESVRSFAWSDNLFNLRGTSLNEPATGSIFKVPEYIRATDPRAYEPKVISIGPYHQHNPHLKPMNQVKLLYFNRLLLRNNGVSAEDYIQLISGLITQSKGCYPENINMRDNDFSKMLLLDGCFIIELLLENHSRNDGQRRGDSILDNMSTLSLVQFDMLLLENQLPFVVLESLFNLVTGTDEENPSPEAQSLVKIASELFSGLIDHLVPLPDRYFPPPATDFYHLLHLFHACFIASPIDDPTESMLMTPSASDLMNVDIEFKPKTDRSFSWHISYKQGVVDIFPARLNSYSNSFYRNLITFEQCFFRDIRSRIMGYVMLMSCLIDSEVDLNLLRREGIVAYTLDNHEATLFFRKLCRDSVLDYSKSYLSHLQDLSSKVWNLYRAEWPRYKTKLKRSPMKYTYLIASAVFFIVLTILQTVYTVLAYYQPSDSNLRMRT